MYALPGYNDGEENEHDRTGKGRQGVDLARAEIEPRVLCVPAGVEIGERGNGQGRGVGAHVETIGQERHGAEGDAGRNFDDHRHRRNEDDDQSASFAVSPFILPEGVVVAPVPDISRVHHASSLAYDLAERRHRSITLLWDRTVFPGAGTTSRCGCPPA